MPRRREGPAKIFAGGIRGRKKAKDLESNGLGARRGEEASGVPRKSGRRLGPSLCPFREPSGRGQYR